MAEIDDLQVEENGEQNIGSDTEEDREDEAKGENENLLGKTSK